MHPVAPIQAISFFFFNDTATTEIYTLSLHDALPICRSRGPRADRRCRRRVRVARLPRGGRQSRLGKSRSEEHTSELQSRPHLVCRLLLEKKKRKHDRPQSAYHGSNAMWKPIFTDDQS